MGEAADAARRSRPVAVIDANLLRDQRAIEERQATYRSTGEQIVIADAVAAHDEASAGTARRRGHGCGRPRRFPPESGSN